MEFKQCKIDLDEKADNLEEGEFSGMLAVFGNIDQGNDMIEKGAFSRTLKHKNNQVPMLWQHDTRNPIGVGLVSIEDKGLRMKGKLNLGVQKAVEALELIRQKSVKGLSIGFETLKHEFKKDVRVIKEAKLWEGSVVTFPMNLRATIDQVKLFMPFAKEVNELDEEKLKNISVLLGVGIDDIKASANQPGIDFDSLLYQVIGKANVLKDSSNFNFDSDGIRKAIGTLNALLEKSANPDSSSDNGPDEWDDVPEPGDVDKETVSSVEKLISSLNSYNKD